MVPREMKHVLVKDRQQELEKQNLASLLSHAKIWNGVIGKEHGLAMRDESKIKKKVWGNQTTRE